MCGVREARGWSTLQHLCPPGYTGRLLCGGDYLQSAQGHIDPGGEPANGGSEAMGTWVELKL